MTRENLYGMTDMSQDRLRPLERFASSRLQMYLTLGLVH